jgi:uncharacterized protein (DUF3084 family)
LLLEPHNGEGDLFVVTLGTLTQQLEATGTRPDWLQSWREQLTTLATDRQKVQQELEKVRSSDELTERGKANRTAALYTALQERLKVSQTALEGYRKHIAQLRPGAGAPQRDRRGVALFGL